MEKSKKTCQTCRKREATKRLLNSAGRPMWRCDVCFSLKNKPGFTRKQ